MTSVKNELIGTWELLSYIEVPADGSDSIFPMGQNPKGILIYGADNYMSLQISATVRSPYSTNDRSVAPESELIDGLTSYIAYSGTYQINNHSGIVTYHIINSLFPNWEGKTLMRKVTFESDVLYLNSVEPVLSNNKLVNSYLTWKKVDRQSSTNDKLVNRKENVNTFSEL